LLWGFWREKSIAVRGASLAVLGTSIFLCTSISYASAQIYPDGNRVSPNNVAYIEASNLELKSEEGWRPDGIAGLALTLMRNGYVTMNLPEITQDRLEHAGLVVSIAPQRPFTYAEREAIKSFIENGGNFILTAGWGDHEAAAPLLKELQLWVGEDPDHPGERPPVPMGHFKSPYVDAGGYMAHVRYNAAWPVGSTDKDARVIAYGTGNVPVIIMRSVGKGKVMLVGDTGFAMNKNLEWEGGEPFDGMRENADFWRWLITVLKNETMWLPPNPNAPKSDAGARSTGGAGAPMAPPPVIPMPRFSPLLGPSRPMIPATRSLVVAPATQGANDSGSARPPVATPSTNPSTRGAQ
jgi:hypothetical protein